MREDLREDIILRTESLCSSVIALRSSTSTSKFSFFLRIYLIVLSSDLIRVSNLEM